jgi:hypothetical protein
MDKEIETEDINLSILKLKTQQLQCDDKAQGYQIKSEIIKQQDAQRRLRDLCK